MERSIFDEWFDENINSWVSSSINNTVDPSEVDNIGVMDVADFFSVVSSFLVESSEVIALYDNKMSLSNAYNILSATIAWLTDNEILEDDWDDIADLFARRADEFVGGSEHIINELSTEPSKWTAALDQIMYSYKLALDDSYGDLSADKKILFIRSTLLSFRTKGYLDYSWPWFKQLIASLEVDWRVMGGGFPTGIDPTYVPPWSVG
jgi:hypothetical protein